MSVFDHSAAITIMTFGIGAMVFVGLGIYWLVNKRAKLRHLAYLRARLAELSPSDPEYNLVRTLHTSMVIDAERWGFFHGDTASGDPSGNLAHVGSDSVSGGGGDHH